MHVKESKKWLQTAEGAEVISRKLEKAGVKVSMTSGMTTRELIEREPKRISVAKPRSVVYEIPCGGCYKSYVRETGRGIEIRLKEHKSDVRFHRLSNAIVLHIEKCNHMPDWEGTKILEKNIKKQTRKILEAAHISSRDTFNSRNGFISLAAGAVSLAVDPSWNDHVEVPPFLFRVWLRRFIPVCYHFFDSFTGTVIKVP